DHRVAADAVVGPVVAVELGRVARSREVDRHVTADAAGAGRRGDAMLGARALDRVVRDVAAAAADARDRRQLERARRVPAEAVDVPDTARIVDLELVLAVLQIDIADD